MGKEQENPAAAGSSAVAGGAPYPPQAPAGVAGAAAPQTYSPQPTQFPHQQQYGAAPMPGSVPPYQQTYPMAPNYYAQQQFAVAAGRPPLVSIISPDHAKKIRKMQWVNFACTMVQLICSLAIILIVRSKLASIVVGEGGYWWYVCYAAVPGQAYICEYAYALASVSIFFCFILSLMQCLTMDCCGVGRVVEAAFDFAACIWWIAGAIALGVYANEANNAGVPQQDARNANVALSCLSALMFLALLVTNLVLIKRLGKAYKAAHQQLQQHLTAHPVPGAAAPYGVQMATNAPPAGMYGAPTAQMGAGPPMQPMQQQQQQQQWGAPPGYPTNPPQAGAAPMTGQHAV